MSGAAVTGNGEVGSPRPPRRRVWEVVLAGLAFVAVGSTLLGARPAADEWYDYYHRAQRAIDRSDWDGAIRELELAVAERDESSRNARTYGVRFVRYFPYYYLGVAHFGAGDDAAARSFLDLEQQEGEIQRNDDFAERLNILIETLAGPGGSGLEGLPADEVEGVLVEVERLRSQERPLEAMEMVERLLALDERHGRLLPDLAELRMEALREELDRSEVQARGTREESAGEITASAAAAVLEAKVREIFQRGVDLMTAGDLDAALTRFELTLAFLEDEGWTSRELYAEAREHKELVATEVRRAREAEMRARIAAEAGLARTPPEIMLISPSRLDEPLATEIVRIQGVAHDAHGVGGIDVLVNGQVWGEAEVGTRSRDIRVSARAGGDTGLGTFAQFSKDLVLPRSDNDVVVRVTNVNGQTSELELSIRVRAAESRVFAAIIGVGDYEDPGIPDLAYATADAREFRTYLQRDLGIPEDQVFTLLDGDATYTALRRLFRTELRREAGENDQVIIYFAGHGAPDQFGDAEDGDGVEKYLLPHDADPEDISGTGYPMQEVADALSRLSAQRVVYIADACFSGASGGRTLGRGTGVTISDGFLGRLTGQAPGRVILSASGANEPSLESDALGHGVFTYFLLDGLRGAADADSNRLITVPEVYSYVARMVPESTGRRQHPTMSGELGGEMILGRLDPR